MLLKLCSGQKLELGEQEGALFARMFFSRCSLPRVVVWSSLAGAVPCVPRPLE